MTIRPSNKAAQFAESVIREMTRVFMARGDKPGANLAQGFPDFAAPESMKDAACAAIKADINQYAITWGTKNLRKAIADKTEKHYGVRPDTETEITVTCGTTEAMMAAMLALVDPGDEVIVFEPFYENYGPDAILSGAVPKFVTLREPDWSFDEAELTKAFTDKTRAIIINTPNNPTGKVFTKAELEFIAKLCIEWNVVAITDEIYEHMLYDGRKHIRMADLPGMKERTVTISGISKTYSATGWRVGWLLAPPEATNAIRKVHDFLTVGAAAPLQEAAAHALTYPDSYYVDLEKSYQQKRDTLMATLKQVGFKTFDTGGAYYIMTDASELMALAGYDNDVEFAHWMIREIGVATVPGSSFYRNKADGRTKVRFCYCKKPETLKLAHDLLVEGFGRLKAGELKVAGGSR
ncbi:MAG TPA: aminotransferase class I/II-fold pyridoxal phosphate-dependent enzyme [Alphaproteobacteria bacterium]|nr:aminotransferase class I/II-fold pyridoxal phosphate-dependent enzyme [Alphaproteobacteria bacterium]